MKVKRVKLLVWILILFLIEILLINRLGFFASAPDIVFAFVIVYAALEEDYAYAVTVAIICGVCTGSVCSGSFPVSVLMYSYSALLVRALINKPRYIPVPAKTIFWALVLSMIGNAVIYFTLSLTFELRILTKSVIPFGVCNAAAAAIIYPLVKRTILAVDEKKKLIPD